MVGDDLEADVEGAIAAGLLGIALRTGKYRTDSEPRAREVSTAVLNSLAELPDWLGLSGCVPIVVEIRFWRGLRAIG